MEQVVNVGTIVAGSVQLFTDHKQHKQQIGQDQHHHNEELSVAEQQLLESLKAEKIKYLISIFADVESYYQELNGNLLNNTLDAERDMIDQRNQQYQTLLISSTIMIGATIGILFQAPMPTDAPDEAVIIYATAIAASILFLLIAIGLCIKILISVGKYMKENSRIYINHFQQTRDITRNIIANFPTRKQASIIGSAPPSELELLWKNHECNIFDYLGARQKYDIELTRLKTNDGLRRFHNFWKYYCSRLGSLVSWLFYLGTITMLLSIEIYFYCLFWYRFQSSIASYITVSIIGTGSLITIIAVGYLRATNPHSEPPPLAAEKEEDNRLNRLLLPSASFPGISSTTFDDLLALRSSSFSFSVHNKKSS